MPVLATLSQIGYPDAGDIDDCWAVASIWAARCADPRIPAPGPSMTTFREAAERPDTAGPTGGNSTNIVKAISRLWPHLRYVDLRTPYWDELMDRLRRGHFVTIGVLSSVLPASLRFGFQGAHQLGVALVDGRLRIMQPLARDGSPLLSITEAALRAAAFALFGGREYRAVVIEPVEEDMDPARDLPSAVLTVRGGGTVYANPDRTSVLIPVFGEAGKAYQVGVYSRPAVPTDERGRAALACGRFQLKSGAEAPKFLGWFGDDLIVPAEPVDEDALFNAGVDAAIAAANTARRSG